jgi:hypothetical protein
VSVLRRARGSTARGIEGGGRGEFEDVLTGANDDERQAQSGRPRTASSPTRSPAVAAARLAAGRRRRGWLQGEARSLGLGHVL